MVSDLLSALTPDQMLSRIVLYAVVQQLLGGALQPYWRELEQRVNARTPNEVLSPSELASAVVRTFLTEGEAAAEAEKSGIDPARFHTLVEIIGQALGPQDLAIALRRGIIPEDAGDPAGVGFIQGIAQGNLATKWADVVKALAVLLPSPESALDALLEGQTDDATARELYARFGGDPQYFDLLFNTRGQAPTPTQALELLNRGIIPERGTGPEATSYEQAFLEGPWRNKWLEPFIALREYLPPPRTVTAMLRNGSLTDAQALDLYHKYGLSEATAAAYITDAHHQKTASTHELARTTLQELYHDQIISRAQLTSSLTAQGWSDADAEYLAQVIDVKRQQQALNAVINRVHTLYVGHKIERATVTGAFTAMGLPDAQQAGILELWDLERSAAAADLTAAQIEAAVFYKVITMDEGIARLERRGYTPHDAWIALSVRLHGPQPGEPAPDAVPGGN